MRTNDFLKFLKVFAFSLTTAVLFSSFDKGEGGTTTQTFTVGSVSFTMKKVTGGTFKMGAQSADVTAANYDAEANSWEAPVHSVTVGDFWIGETEVTQALWEAVMGNNPSSFAGKPNNPVESVSWDDIQEFITKLNTATGKTFRLPTEAEWEFAARGGKQSAGYKYSGSNTVGNVAWYWDNIPSQTEGEAGYGTQPVKTKQANELGLYDMSGNVWEWCSDCWRDDYNASQNCSYRVFRGGSWFSIAMDSRVSFRNYYTPDYAYYNLGFRLSSGSN